MQLVAVPSPGYVFSGWQGYTGCSSDPACTITVTSTVAISLSFAASPNFTLSATPSSVSVNAGSSATAQIVATPTNGFTGTIQYSCSDSAPMSSCSVSSAGVLNIATMNTANVLPVAIVLLIGGLMLIPTKKRKTTLAVGGLLLLSACGSGGNTATTPAGHKTPAGTYTVMVSGQSGSISRQTSVTLIVE